MEYIKITEENLEREHICCAISNGSDVQVTSKKAWLSGRLKDGLVFLKAAERGKGFIEYIPAENAWYPIEADGYMHINCFWVSGALKGRGYSEDLLSACSADARAQGKNGLTVISSHKKQAFLSDPEHLAYKGFKKADCAEPFFTLMYMPFFEGAPVPKFKAAAKTARTEKKALRFTTRTVVRLQQNTFRLSNVSPRTEEYRSRAFCWTIKRKLVTLPRSGPITLCFTTENSSPTKFRTKNGLRSLSKNFAPISRRSAYMWLGRNLTYNGAYAQKYF